MPDGVIHGQQIHKTLEHHRKETALCVEGWGGNTTTLAEIHTRKDRKRNGEDPVAMDIPLTRSSSKEPSGEGHPAHTLL